MNRRLIFKLSLRSKLIGASLLVLAPVLALLIQNYRSAYDAQQQQVLADQVRVAQTVSVVVDNLFDQALALSGSYATDPVVMSLNRTRINSYLARLAPLYPQYEAAVGVFDVKGNFIASSNIVTVTVTVNVADREWFKTVIREDKPIITGVLISRVTGRPIVGAVTPMHDPSGKLIGLVTSNLDLRHLPTTLETIKHGSEEHIFLVDRTGTTAFDTGEPGFEAGARDFADYPPVVAALAGHTFTGENVRNPRGETRMVAALPTPKYGWIVGVSTPVSVALAPVQASLKTTLLVFAAVVAITIGITLALSDFFVRPLRQLSAHAVALGRGELPQHANIATGDEFEDLGNTFNAMADEVQRALRLREEFLSVASHELRTPLTVIKGYSQWLVLKETDEERRKALGTIVRQVDRMSELLDEMLTVSEINAVRIEFHKKRIDLAALVKEVVDRMQTLATHHNLIFHSVGTPIVNADRNQIEVVVTNLVDNAVRYSPGGGDVQIEVAVTDDQAMTSVRDHGMGIPEDKRQHVFEPFFQLQPAIAGYGGMGLGLFISKQIIERHSGRIWFETEEGRGSTFYFALPLAPAGET